MFHDNKSGVPRRHVAKVRDLGREILRKADHCSWIGYMTENDPCTPQPLMVGRRRAATPTLEASSKKTSAAATNAVGANDPATLHGQGEAASDMAHKNTYNTVPPTGATVATTNAAIPANPGSFSDPQLQRQMAMAATAATATTAAEGRDSASQLELLMNLKEQHDKLIEQQKTLQEQIQHQLELQMRSSLGQNNCSKTGSVRRFDEDRLCAMGTPVSSPLTARRMSSVAESIADSVDSRDGSPIGSERGCYTGDMQGQTRRRLKGSVAQTCALRDEGSLGSLIWSEQQGDDSPRERRSECNWPCNKPPVNVVKSASSKGRNRSDEARRAQEGAAMSQLLRMNGGNFGELDARSDQDTVLQVEP